MTHKRNPTTVVVLNMLYEFATEDEADRFMECVRHRDEKTCMAETRPQAIRADDAQHPYIEKNDWV